MLISQNELKLHGIDLEIDKLEKGLVQLGHEVEGYVEYKNENLLVGLTTECVKHPEADKLNIVTVDTGTKLLTIVCGAPNVGKDQYVIVAIEGCKLGDIEIKNTKLRGVESQGMLCSLAEIGLEDKVLTEEDKDGIFNFDSKHELGSNALRALGLEDKVLDVSLTANRGDCLSYVGILRDLNAFLNTKLENVSFAHKPTIDNPYIPKINDENSKQLSTLLIKDVKVTNSPDWLKIWLAKHEIKSQNNIVDLANYVMFELGLPIHTYDADMISGNISSNVVDATLEGTSFVALDGNEYELALDSIIIKDDKKIISLASVMGSDATKITNGTTNVLMEIGVFDPILVRKTAAKMLSKKTDASIRGEKNVDFNQVDNAYYLFISKLDKMQNDIKVSNINRDIKDIDSKQVTLKLRDVTNILGLDIPIKDITNILNNLHFETIMLDDSQITVSIPSWRFDVTNDHDLIEEIIRVYDMDNVTIGTKMTSFISADKIIKDKKIKIERFLEKEMLNLGLNQTITYSLVSADEIEEFNGTLENAIELMMPLSNKHQYYRQSLVPSLMNVAKYNFDRQQKCANIFEIGNTYTLENDQIIEKYYLSGLVSGIKSQHQDSGVVNYDFYDLKYVVESILDKVNIKYDIVKSSKEIKELNKYGHADIVVDGEVVGFIASKHPNYYKKMKSSVFVFEIELSKIENLINHDIFYKKVNNNPIVERDLTIHAPIDTKYSDIVSVFDNVDYVFNVECSYIYSGEKITSGMKAVTFKVAFTDEATTLEGHLVDESVKKLTANILNKGLEFKNE